MNFLNKTIKAIRDRPLGSKHPEHNWKYTINYGFIPNTKASDGKKIDAYILGPKEALKEFSGKFIEIIRRKNDEDKLVLANKNYTKEEIKKLTYFQEKYFKSEIISFSS